MFCIPAMACLNDYFMRCPLNALLFSSTFNIKFELSTCCQYILCNWLCHVSAVFLNIIAENNASEDNDNSNMIAIVW